MNALRSYCAHSCVHMSQIHHTSSILLLLCSSNTPQNNTNMTSSLFSFDLTLYSSPLYLSLGYLAVFSCNHLYSVGARLILPSSVATYNTALNLSKLAHWRLKWPCDFGLQARLWRIAISVCNVMICGRIILRNITKYIAYYHIAELYAHASILIVCKYVGLERCVKYFIENDKITVMWLTACFCAAARMQRIPWCPLAMD